MKTLQHQLLLWEYHYENLLLVMLNVWETISWEKCQIILIDLARYKPFLGGIRSKAMSETKLISF